VSYRTARGTPPHRIERGELVPVSGRTAGIRAETVDGRFTVNRRSPGRLNCLERSDILARPKGLSLTHNSDPLEKINRILSEIIE